jgi:hypothetical protein
MLRDGGSGAMRCAILSLVVLLAGCSNSEAPAAAAASLPEAAEVVPSGPVQPDFDATQNAFYRECMQGQHDVKQCVCTTQTLKDGVDADIYQSMFASGMSAVIPLKGKASEAVNTALTKAMKECRGR